MISLAVPAMLCDVAPAAGAARLTRRRPRQLVFARFLNEKSTAPGGGVAEKNGHRRQAWPRIDRPGHVGLDSLESAALIAETSDSASSVRKYIKIEHLRLTRTCQEPTSSGDR